MAAAAKPRFRDLRDVDGPSFAGDPLAVLWDPETGKFVGGALSEGGGPETDPIATAALELHEAEEPAHGGDLAGDPRPPTTHDHDSRYYTEAEVDGALALKQNAATAATDTELAAEATTRANADTANAAAAAAAQAAADAALPKAGGTMTGKIVLDGDPTANLHPATRQYVAAQIAALINGAPGALDTLKEIADQLGADESAVAALTATVAGKLGAAQNLSDLANAVTARTNLGLGSAATQASGAFDAAGAAAAAQAASQPLDSDLTALAGIAPSNDDLVQRKAGAWTNRTPAQVKTDLALAKGDVGLGNVDNTSDAGKPVSTAQQTALDAKIAATLADAKGDLLVATAADVVARKAVGSDGTALTADSAQSDGVVWGGPMRQRVATGRYLICPHVGITTTAQAAGFLGCTLIFVPARQSFDRITINITTQQPGNVRLGLYADNGGVPGALILDAGTVDCSTPGNKSITINQSLPAGPVWAAILCEHTGGGNVAFSAQSTLCVNTHTTLSFPAATSPDSLHYRLSIAAGALPNPYGTATPTNSAAPVIGLRAA